MLPYLLYCVEVGGNGSKYILDPVIRIQKRFLRIITYSSYRARTDVLFKSLDILPFSIFMHKIHLNNSPECSISNNMFRSKKDTYT